LQIGEKNPPFSMISSENVEIILCFRAIFTGSRLGLHSGVLADALIIIELDQSGSW
jgi:hypothetical protein